MKFTPQKAAFNSARRSARPPRIVWPVVILANGRHCDRSQPQVEDLTKLVAATYTPRHQAVPA